MFFDNIIGTSDNGSNNNENENDNDRYSLKHVSLRQGRAFLKDEKKIKRSNTYLAQNINETGIVGMNIEGFENNGSQQPEAASASASASSAPAPVSSTSSDSSSSTATTATTATTTHLDELDKAFDAKMAAYSSALSEYNKELLKSQNFFVVRVRSLAPINSCFNCDASLSGTDCSAMGVSNSNGDIITALPNSTSPTANLPPCVNAGVTVPGWSADPSNSGTCVAPLGQKCCTPYMLNGQPVCQAAFGADNYDESAMNSWISQCITPPSPEEINQRIALANEHCQGNGISLNYWNTNANNFVLVTTQDPANSNRPFAKMNSIPVWIINTYTSLNDATKAKSALAFSPTVEKTLSSAREDMLNAGTALIKAISSQHSVTLAERKAMEQKINAIRSKISKLDSHKQSLDHSSDIKESFQSSSTLSDSLQGQEEDTRIQFKSNYARYSVWFIIAIFLFIVMFSNIFMVSKDGEGGSEEGSSSSSIMLTIGSLVMLVFLYFIIQYILAYFRVSRPDLPFDSVNPLL